MILSATARMHLLTVVVGATIKISQDPGETMWCHCQPSTLMMNMIIPGDVIYIVGSQLLIVGVFIECVFEEVGFITINFMLVD